MRNYQGYMRLQNVSFKQGNWLYSGVVSVLYSRKCQNISTLNSYFIYIIYTPAGLNYETE